MKPWTAAVVCVALAAAEPLPLDRGWRFLRVEGTAPVQGVSPAAPGFPDGTWEPVVLPHTARLEAPETSNRPFQGLCWYRQRLTLQPGWKGKRVTLRFDGAMQQAEVFVDGQLRATHAGGYLPFTVDLTAEARRGGAVTVALRLDNRDAPEIPPGKPQKDMDFSYFGGLYRRAWVVVSDPLRLTDPLEDGGGVRVRTLTASGAEAKVVLKARVQNDRSGAEVVRIRHLLSDASGRVAARWTGAPSPLAPGAVANTEVTLTVRRPRLWHPDHPALYTLRTEVLAGDRVVDRQVDTVGLRTVEVTPEGLRVNGAPLKLRGANRHNDMPWLGNAIPDPAQERDARRLKAAGFNFLRLAHYPQSPAFLEACDRLGLLVGVCVPGWQWFRDTPVFRERVAADVRTMVRRDRNHPSVLYWETSLNETYRPPDAFFTNLVRIAREEHPGGLTGGDTLGRKDAAAVGYDLPYTLWTDFYDRPMAKGLEGRLGLHREYGDYEFGGEHSTSRMARGDGPTALRLQAWNYQWAHNRNRGWAHTLGDAIWVGIDHFRGCSEDAPVSRCGSLDLFRLPKYSWHLFRSQRDPDRVRTDVESGPMAFLATDWSGATEAGRVVAFSNADTVELFLNGRSLGVRRPDAGPDAAYAVPIPDADPNYWQKDQGVRQDAAKARRTIPADVEARIFDGGNARHLDHPPFTFPSVPWEPGELKVVARRGGRVVATDVRRTPGEPVALRLSLDEAGVPLRGDGVDAAFLRVALVDAAGTVVPRSGLEVTLTVEGPGQLLSGPTTVTEAGIASPLLRVNRRGTLKLKAVAPGFPSASLIVRAR